MSKINLAVIDDDELYVLALKKLIDGVQLTDKTVYFENGKLALNYLDQFIHHSHLLPELILLDSNMPETNGWQFIKEFRKLKTKIDKKITIYMISDTKNEEEIHRARETEEITDFICKPVTMHTLSKILSELN
ncbi:response regulator [Pedobacter sp. P351]|uniref:response regulator n=1 Tax=Pedobacter superstes TaxID=3133441 RepID=UPI0030A16C19